jgi:DNA-binding transcriptional MerR regulator
VWYNNTVNKRGDSMVKVLPGTTIEISELTKGISRTLFDGIFAAGGITLSQVSVMTGLEPYMIQNWVKRGFVSSPQKRQYSKDQFARIVTLNMLKESLQLDKICDMLSYINGALDDESDNLINDSELYHKYVDLVAESKGGIITDSQAIAKAVENAAKEYEEPIPGARQRLIKILQVMTYAHYASISRKAAEEILSKLD